MRMQTFVVEFRHCFPVDMLRYDQCWPSAPIDAELITRHSAPVEQAGTWRVRLARYVHRASDEPTVARWKSFGCTVTDVHTYRS